MNLSSDFKQNLHRLIGKKLWGVVAGSGTGSVIDLKIGELIPLDTPIDNEYLTEIVKNNDSEFCLFIECIWRLDSLGEIICGGWDDNSENGIMLTGINQLLDSSITEINISEPSFDLQITFSNNLKLNVFCDQTDKDSDNYSYFTPKIIYVVGNKSILKTEECEND